MKSTSWRNLGTMASLADVHIHLSNWRFQRCSQFRWCFLLFFYKTSRSWFLQLTLTIQVDVTKFNMMLTISSLLISKPLDNSISSIHFVTINSIRDDQFNSWWSNHFVTINSIRDDQFISWRSILFVTINSIHAFQKWLVATVTVPRENVMKISIKIFIMVV